MKRPEVNTEHLPLPVVLLLFKIFVCVRVWVHTLICLNADAHFLQCGRSEDNLKCQSSPFTWLETGSYIFWGICQAYWPSSFRDSPSQHHHLPLGPNDNTCTVLPWACVFWGNWNLGPHICLVKILLPESSL